MKKNKLISSILIGGTLISNSSLVFAKDINNLEVQVNEDVSNIVGGSATMNFDTYFDDVKCDSISLTVGTPTPNATLPTLEKKGYIFCGWETKDGKEITNENITEAFDTFVGGATTTVYARWALTEPIIANPNGGSMTLHFDSKEGTECEDISIEVGTPPIAYELPTPIKIGYNFLGWYTKDDVLITGENTYNAFDSIKAMEESTVYAKWEKQNPINASSSISIEKIENSEEYYENIQAVYNYADGSKIEEITKNKKIDDFLIETFTTTISYDSNGNVVSNTGLGTYYGYSEYYKVTAKNCYSLKVTDTKGNPIQGVVINFKTDEDDVNLTTNENGETSINYNKKFNYKINIVSLPDGYKVKEDTTLGLGCMYSVIYQNEIILEKTNTIEDVNDKENTDSTIDDVNNKENTIIEDINTKENIDSTIEDINIKENINTITKDIDIDNVLKDVDKTIEGINIKEDTNIEETTPQTSDSSNITFYGIISIFSLTFIIKFLKKHFNN